jgi:hypothetical protein
MFAIESGGGGCVVGERIQVGGWRVRGVGQNSWASLHIIIESVGHHSMSANFLPHIYQEALAFITHHLWDAQCAVPHLRGGSNCIYQPTDTVSLHKMRFVVRASECLDLSA